MPKRKPKRRNLPLSRQRRSALPMRKLLLKPKHLRRRQMLNLLSNKGSRQNRRNRKPKKNDKQPLTETTEKNNKRKRK